MYRAHVFEWIKRIKEGRTISENDERGGRCSTSLNEKMIQKIRIHIRGHRSLIIMELSNQFQSHLDKFKLF